MRLICKIKENDRRGISNHDMAKVCQQIHVSVMGHNTLLLLPSRRLSHWGSLGMTLSSVQYWDGGSVQCPSLREMNKWRCVPGGCKQTWLWPTSHTSHPDVGSWRVKEIAQLPGWLSQSDCLSGGDKPWRPLLGSPKVDLWNMGSLIQIVFLGCWSLLLAGHGASICGLWTAGILWRLWHEMWSVWHELFSTGDLLLPWWCHSLSSAVTL